MEQLDIYGNFTTEKTKPSPATKKQKKVVLRYRASWTDYFGHRFEGEGVSEAQARHFLVEEIAKSNFPNPHFAHHSDKVHIEVYTLN